MAEPDIMEAVSSVIAERMRDPSTERSYVAALLQSGVSKVRVKVVEEAAEVFEAAGEGGETGRDHLVKEVADLVFHALVLLAQRGASWSDVEAELVRRFGTSGIAEKESRGVPKSGGG